MDTGRIEPDIVQPAEPPPNVSRNFQSLLALNNMYGKRGSHIYDGSVARAEVDRRRARNRVSKRSRSANRKLATRKKK